MLLSFFLRPLLFCLFVRIPRLECARSELVSDVPVFFLRAWLCARLWIYVCAGLCVLLCAYVCPLLVVCFSVCAWGVDLGFHIPLCAGGLFQLLVQVGLRGYAWQVFLAV